MNTQKYLPFGCIAPNLICWRELREYPGISGTGFFCMLPPYDDIFYITARHCVKELSIGNCCLQIILESGSNKAVPFSYCIEVSTNNSTDEGREDISVFVVRRDTDVRTNNILQNRALKLQPQYVVSSILEDSLRYKKKVRTIGFPKHNHPNCKTEIDYSKMQGRFHPRGFNGVLARDKFCSSNQYCIEDTNWKEEDYNGFSGSPVIGFGVDGLKVVPFPIGIITMAAGVTARFLNINVATNLITSFLKNEIVDVIIKEL